MWGRGLIGKGDGWEGRDGCIAAGQFIGGGRKVEEKRGSSGMKDVGWSLHGEGLFLFFWQATVECTPHSLSVNQTYTKKETETESDSRGVKRKVS